MHNLNQPIINNLQLDLLVNKGCNNICLSILGRTKKTKLNSLLLRLPFLLLVQKTVDRLLQFTLWHFHLHKGHFPNLLQLDNHISGLLIFVMLFLRRQYVRRTKLKRKGSHKNADHQANPRRTFNVTEIWRRLLEKLKHGWPGFQVTDSQRGRSAIKTNICCLD